RSPVLYPVELRARESRAFVRNRATRRQRGRGVANVPGAMRRPAVVLLLLLSSCSGPGARVPRGITVVLAPPEAPPPELVAAAQERLQHAGTYDGPVDGELTPAVRVAIVQFQRATGLEVT